MLILKHIFIFFWGHSKPLKLTKMSKILGLLCTLSESPAPELVFHLVSPAPELVFNLVSLAPDSELVFQMVSPAPEHVFFSASVAPFGAGDAKWKTSSGAGDANRVPIIKKFLTFWLIWGG